MTPREVADRDAEQAKATAVDASRRGYMLLGEVAIWTGLGETVPSALGKTCAHERDWAFLFSALMAWAAASDPHEHMRLRLAVEQAAERYMA